MHAPQNEGACSLLLLLQPILLFPVLDVRIVVRHVWADVLGPSVDVLPSNSC